MGKSKVRIDRQATAYCSLQGSEGQGILTSTPRALACQSWERRLWFLIWSFPFCLSFKQHVQAVSNGVYTLLGLTGDGLEQLQSWMQPVLPWQLAGQVDEAQADESGHCKSFYLLVLTKLAGKGNSTWHREVRIAFPKLWHHFLSRWHWIIPKEW